jgi:hypothetical protein
MSVIGGRYPSAAANRGQANLSDLMYTLSVNFLLYVVLIIVFYMLVRFYLDEETTHNDGGYAKLPTSAEDDDEVETEGELSDSVNKSAKAVNGTETAADGSFLNVNEWGEPEGTKQEVIQKAIFCAVGLNVSFCIWGLVQERILTQTYDGEFFNHSYGLVFLNRLGGLVLSACLVYYFKIEWVKSPLWEYSHQ